MAKKDKKWKKVTRKIDGKDVEVYERDMPAKKYKDPKNKNSGKTTKITAQINPTTGIIRFYERKEKKNGEITIGGKTYTDKLISKEESFTRGLAASQTGHGTITAQGTLYKNYFQADNPDAKKQYTQVITQAKEQIFAQLEEDKKNKVGNGAGKILKKIEDGTYEAYSSINNEEESTEDDNTQTGEDTETEVEALSPEKARELLEGNKSFNRKKYPVGRKGSFYQYPQKIPDLGYDYIKITAYEYTAGGIKSFNIKDRESAKQRIIKEAKELETVVLPMQPNFSESNAVSWGGDNINPFQMIGAGFAGRIMDSISKLGFDNAGAGNDIAGAFATLGADAKKMLDDPNTAAAVKAYFAGQAVGANVLGRTAGVTLNPNLELLFKGPNLRTFNFNFRFTPRNAKESQEVKEIIRVFKKNMAVQRSESNLFLLTPNVFTLEYIYNNKGESAGHQHPYLNKFKPLAMTNLNVNYTPDGTYMTYNDTGSLTSTDLQMSFGELEPIYADEYNEEGFENHANMGY